MWWSIGAIALIGLPVSPPAVPGAPTSEPTAPSPPQIFTEGIPREFYFSRVA